MPTKRRTAKRAEYPITPEAVAAFGKGDVATLRRVLGLKPWHHCPLDVGDWDRPAWFAQADWDLQQELRAELIEAGEKPCR